MPALFGNGGELQVPLLSAPSLTTSLSYTPNSPFSLPTTTAFDPLKATDVYQIGPASVADASLRLSEHQEEDRFHPPLEALEERILVTTTETTSPTYDASDLEEPMKPWTIRAAVWSSVLGTLSFLGVAHHLRLDSSYPSENIENKSWVATSSSRLDRIACNWIGICGATHLRKSKWKSKHDREQVWRKKPLDAAKYWTSGTEGESTWSPEERRLREIPQYVLDHAPYVHLFSAEEYWPCDIAEHLVHTTPHLNYDPVEEDLRYPSLGNLEDLNTYGRQIFLQSDDNVEDDPDWLGGEENIPSGRRQKHVYQRRPDYQKGKKKWSLRPNKEVYHDDELDKWFKVSNDTAPTKNEWKTSGSSSTGMHRQESESAGGRSDAPAVLIVADKGDDVVDAFWFYFYSYNLGNTFFSVRFGNHVGDWEHTAIRFHKGQPKLVFLSEHSWGEAYAWEALEKIGKRAITYSASGTHAMYGFPGTHEYVLPFGLLYDITDRGPLWDPMMNMHSFTYDYRNDIIRSSQLNPQAPTSWFYFLGHWGDKFYPLSDPRQYRFAGQYHYVNGPLGPRYKRLNRKHICQGEEDEPCDIRTTVNKKVRTWKGQGEGENLSDEDKAWAMRHYELKSRAYSPMPAQAQR